MRMKTKWIAYVLAAAMVVTSAPTNVTLVSAAGPASSSMKKEAKTNLVSWNQEYVDYENDEHDSKETQYKISADGTELSREDVFTGASKYLGYSISAIEPDYYYNTDETDEDGNDIYEYASQGNTAELNKLIGITDVASGTSVTYTPGWSYDYQWYVLDEKGQEQELENQTNFTLYLDTDNNVIKNTDGEKTYICQIVPSYLNYKYTDVDGNEESGYYYFNNISDADQYNWTLTYKYTVKYAGLTAEDFGDNGSVDVNDMITGLDGEDTVAHYSDYRGYTENASGAAIWSGDLNSGLSRNTDPDNEMPDNYDSDNVQFKYVWKAFNAEGKEVVLKDSEKVNNYNDGFSNYVPSLSGQGTTEVFDGEVDDIAYFQVDVDYYYGYIKLGSFSRKFRTEYAPFTVDPSLDEPSEIKVRDDGKVTLKVNRVSLNDEDVVYGYTYQWYRVPQKGDEEKLDGETTNVLKAKITDVTDEYHCRITAKVRSEYQDDLSYAKDVVFTFTSKDGYLVKDISKSSTELAIGEAQELFIDARADKNYKISYQWEKLSAEDATQTDEDTGEETEGFKVKREVVGSDSSITVKASSDQDYVGAPRTLDNDEFYTWEDVDNYNYSFANYVLTVTTQKGDEEETTYTYYFKLQKKDAEIFSDSNDGEVVAERGEDVDLYAYSEDVTGYKLEKKWYKEITTKKWKDTTYTDPYGDDEDDVDEELPEDTSVCEDDQYADTKGYYTISDEDSSAWTGPFTKTDEDGSQVRFWVKAYNVTYYKEVSSTEDGSVCTLEGMKGKEFNDDRLGTYIVEGKLYSNDTSAGPVKEETLTYDVTYDSDLTIYAKNDDVKAAEGAKANLQVVAINKNKETYPVSYQWAKKNDEGRFVDLPGKNYSVLSFDSVTAEDYGTYCVTVTDPVYGGSTELREAKSLLITLTPKETKVVVYTPDEQTYNANIGDTVSLKTNVDLEDGIKPFYAWYRNEHVTDNYATDSTWSAGEDPEHWELLNVDGSSYDLKVESEDDYTTYLCEMSYLTMKNNTKISVTKKFYFTVEDGYYFDLQKLTPAVQVKKLGTSATYSVKVLTDNPQVKEENVEYQWFTYDEDDKRVDIEGATKSTYTIDKIEKENFGSLYVEAKLKDMPEKYTVTTSFLTKNGDNPASLDDATNNKTLKAKLGENITLMKPVIKDGDGYEWTYQWYKGSQELYGATDPEYTIKNIGENEFGTYYCYISCDDQDFDTFTCTVEEDKDTSHIFAKADEKYAKLAVDSKVDGVAEAVLTRSATLGVTAVSSDDLDLKYQWYKEGTAIGGATESTYTIDVVTPDSYGEYTCEVMDSNNRMVEVTITLKRTYELDKDQTETYDPDDTIGYEVKLGDDLTLTAKANCAKEFTLYYEWYKCDKEEGYQVLEDQTASTLDLKNIQQSDLGNYKCRAYVLNENGVKANVETLNFYYKVYVNTGLVVVPDLSDVIAEADGSVKMHVRAKANADQEIAYEWSKWTEAEDEDDDEIDWEHPQDKDNDKSSWDVINGQDSTEQLTTSYALDPDDNAQTQSVVNAADNSRSTVDDGEWKTISDATGDTYTLPEIKNDDYGTYRVVVYTSGEEYTYKFTLAPHYAVMLDRGDAENVYSATDDQAFDYEYGRVYAEAGDSVNVSAKIVNPAVDMDYTYDWYAQQPFTYDWYAQQPSTVTMMKLDNKANASAITQTIPALVGKAGSPYSVVQYGVKIHAVDKNQTDADKKTDAEEKDADVVFDSNKESSYSTTNQNARAYVLTSVDYDNSQYPETDHPFKQKYSLKGFSLPNDGSYEITFSKDTDADVRVIDDKGTSQSIYWDQKLNLEKDKVERKVTVSGSKVIFYADNSDGDPYEYGYKVLSIKKAASANDTASGNAGNGNGSGSKAATPGAVNATKAAVTAGLKKGAKATSGKLTYKVTKAAKKNGTVALVGVKASAKKSLTKVTVPATVKLKGTTYKVTAVNAKALSGLKKLKSVVIGKNVTKIGANAFNGDKKLKNIDIKSKAVKSIGANAFKGVPAKAKVSVPAAKKKAYKKLLKKAGLKKAKIK